MAGEFEGKVALVTAAADGIGAATATMFAENGARVTLSDIDVSRGEALAEELRSRGFEARFIEADATEEAAVREVIARTVSEWGGLHLAANVVGDAHPGSAGPEFHAQELEAWEHTLAVTLRSTFLCLKHEIAHMIDHGGGAIANVTSLAGMMHNAWGGAAYGSAKAAVIRLTKFAAVSYADRGVRVNCIAPGVTPTRAYYKSGPEAARELIDKQVVDQPIARAIETREQAEGIRWLCSDAAAMVTGHVLPIDGGWTARC